MLTCFVKRDLRKHSGNLNPQKNNYAQYNSRTRRAKNRQNSTKIKKTQNSTTGSTFSLPLLLQLRCCGAVNFVDYEQVFNNLSVPVSCCNTTNPLANETTCPDIVMDTNVTNITDLIYTVVHNSVNLFCTSSYFTGLCSSVSVVLSLHFQCCCWSCYHCRSNTGICILHFHANNYLQLCCRLLEDCMHYLCSVIKFLIAQCIFNITHVGCTEVVNSIVPLHMGETIK